MKNNILVAKCQLKYRTTRKYFLGVPISIFPLNIPNLFSFPKMLILQGFHHKGIPCPYEKDSYIKKLNRPLWNTELHCWLYNSLALDTVKRQLTQPTPSNSNSVQPISVLSTHQSLSASTAFPINLSTYTL